MTTEAENLASSNENAENLKTRKILVDAAADLMDVLGYTSVDLPYWREDKTLERKPAGVLCGHHRESSTRRDRNRKGNAMKIKTCEDCNGYDDADREDSFMSQYDGVWLCDICAEEREADL